MQTRQGYIRAVFFLQRANVTIAVTPLHFCPYSSATVNNGLGNIASLRYNKFRLRYAEPSPHVCLK